MPYVSPGNIPRRVAELEKQAGQFVLPARRERSYPRSVKPRPQKYGVKKANKNKYVLLNAPNDQLPKIISLLPGMKSPTVLPLASPGWSSVHSVIAESDFWEIIEQLKAAGAEGILVIPIEKMIL